MAMGVKRGSSYLSLLLIKLDSLVYMDRYYHALRISKLEPIVTQVQCHPSILTNDTNNIKMAFIVSLKS